MVDPSPFFRPNLVGYNARDLPLRWADVLVIGSGIAGLTAALEAAKFGTVLLVTKAKLSDSTTSWAQGGIAACLSRASADFDKHEQDTQKAGAGLCDPEVVAVVIREGAEAVYKLIEWGTQFDRDASGELELGLEGGHSSPRILHAKGDATGQEVTRALLERVQNHRQIKLMPRVFTVDLMVVDGTCHGALVWNDVQGLQIILARSTILASGGAGRIFRETTNPKVATGDGLAMAFRAGAELMDLEFVQFHPTTIYVAGASRALISEAVRGEGAVLVDRQGRRFMDAVHPLKALAPRDVVSQTILQVMKSQSDTNVFLDASKVKTDVNTRFPGISRLCAQYGLDLSKDLIPVRPSAHYMIGGVKTDPMGATTIQQLFAAGEVACTGLHGANRLASNSLLEGLVFGLRAGRAAGEKAAERVGNLSPESLARKSAGRTQNDLDVADLKASLGSLMWRNVGIERNQELLESAIKQLNFWATYVCGSELAGPRGWEIQNMLTAAWLIATQALQRTETRGTHKRSDFPNLAEVAKHSSISRRQDQLQEHP